jgi:isopentenyl diphosphate isomerase/L-lactate dehydrogenase-like FMN-dependent dehydrogenase
MDKPAAYRKKPVQIQAWQFNGEPNGNQVAAWCGGRFFLSAPFGQKHKPVIEVTTLEGVMEAWPGDWIIKGVQGEFYPCKPDIFAATYEPS